MNLSLSFNKHSTVLIIFKENMISGMVFA